MLMELLAILAITFIDRNKTFDDVNKIKFSCNDINECDISNMFYEHINTSIALPCNHDSGFDFVCPPNLLHINNTFVDLSEMYSSPADNDLLNRGFVNTYHDYQNVCSHTECELIAMPCHIDTDIMFQNCYNLDNFSESSNYIADWSQDANKQLTWGIMAALLGTLWVVLLMYQYNGDTNIG